MTSSIIIGGSLVLLSFVWPLKDKKDVLARALFFFAGALVIILNKQS